MGYWIIILESDYISKTGDSLCFLHKHILITLNIAFCKRSAIYNMILINVPPLFLYNKNYNILTSILGFIKCMQMYTNLFRLNMLHWNSVLQSFIFIVAIYSANTY